MNQVLATLNITQHYFNDSESNKEFIFTLPNLKDYALGKLTIQVGDDIIEGKIMKKAEAKVKYEDTIAKGNTAVMAKESKRSEEITVNVGNLLPQQEVIVNLQMIGIAKLDADAFCLRIPSILFPKN